MEVLQEDQDRISRFGRVLMEMRDSESKVEELQKNIEDMEDSMGELELNDDEEETLVAFSGCFLKKNSRFALEYIRGQKDSVSKEMKTMEELISHNRAELDEIKKLFRKNSKTP